MARGASIKEVRTHGADVKIGVVLAEILQCHPVKM